MARIGLARRRRPKNQVGFKKAREVQERRRRDRARIAPALGASAARAKSATIERKRKAPEASRDLADR